VGQPAAKEPKEAVAFDSCHLSNFVAHDRLI
jgi:hypothetical protein